MEKFFVIEEVESNCDVFVKTYIMCCTDFFLHVCRPSQANRKFRNHDDDHFTFLVVYILYFTWKEICVHVKCDTYKIMCGCCCFFFWLE